MNPKEFKNSLLRSLNAEVIARLNLIPIVFEVGHEIEFPGKAIEHRFFVEEGMASSAVIEVLRTSADVPIPLKRILGL
ncbi:MAG: hypothetical protein NVS9B15_04240 [Acidobacteriaceae bacterium]